MKYTITALLAFVFTTMISAQERPNCLKSVDSKIKNLEKMLVPLEEKKAANQSFNTHSLTTQKANAIRGMRVKLASCKEANSNYDYSKISAKVDELDTRYNAMVNAGNVAEENKEALRKKMQKLQTYVDFVNDYPDVIDEDDRQEYTLKDTQMFLEVASSEEAAGTIEYLREEYEAVLETLNSAEFESTVYEEIDFKFAIRDAQTAVQELTTALTDLEYISGVAFPDSDGLKGINAYIKKLVAKRQAEITSSLSNVLVSEFHGKNLNKILFTANLNLNPESATAADFKTTFEAGQSIKAIAYLDNKYYDIYGRTNRPSYEMLSTINSGQIVQEGFKNTEGAKPYIVFYISQDASSYTASEGDYPGTAVSMEYLTGFSPRKHNIEVRVDSYLGNAQGDAEDRDVEGTFIFDASVDSGMQEMKRSISSIRDKSLATVALPKAGMNNASYETKLITLFNTMGWEERFSKAIIGSSSFGYKKNYLDQVTGRTLQVYMVSKKGDGGCMYQDFTVIQEKVGGNWAAFKRLSTGSQKKISCSKI